jgi:hypothetical protein
MRLGRRHRHGDHKAVSQVEGRLVAVVGRAGIAPVAIPIPEPPQRQPNSTAWPDAIKKSYRSAIVASLKPLPTTWAIGIIGAEPPNYPAAWHHYSLLPTLTSVWHATGLGGEAVGSTCRFSQADNTLFCWISSDGRRRAMAGRLRRKSCAATCASPAGEIHNQTLNVSNEPSKQPGNSGTEPV